MHDNYICQSCSKVIVIVGHKSEFYFYSAVDVGAEQIIVQMKQFEFVEIRFRLVIRLMG